MVNVKIQRYNTTNIMGKFNELLKEGKITQNIQNNNDNKKMFGLEEISW